MSSLSDKKVKTYNQCDCGDYCEACINCYKKDVKVLIKDVEGENDDLETAVLDLIEIHRGKVPPIAQMIKLFKAHKEEREKLAGEALV